MPPYIPKEFNAILTMVSKKKIINFGGCYTRHPHSNRNFSKFHIFIEGQ